MLGPVRVVGHGEATHGSREFVTLERRLLGYLVTEQGFDVFVFEADQEGGKALDAGVTTGEGDPVGSDNLPPARDRLTTVVPGRDLDGVACARCTTRARPPGGDPAL
jgi:hypothetical protein